MKTKIIVGSFLLVAFLGLFSYSAQAIEYGQMGGKPTNFDPDIPDSKSWFIYKLDPGTTKEDSMTVANLFNEPWIAVIYAADSIKSSSGGFALRQLTEPKDAVGNWVKFYPDPKPDFASKVFEEKKTIDEVCKVSGEDLKNNYEFDDGKINEFGEWCKGKEVVELEMKAGEKKDLLFVISIPKDADVGEHTGGILIQKKSKDETAQSDGSKVMLTTRVGVRIYETVPGDIIKKLTFSDFEVTKNFDEFFLPWDKIKKDKFKEYLLTSKIKSASNVSADFSEKIIIHNVITRKTEIIEGREFQVLRDDDFISSLAWKAPRLAYLSFQKEYRYKDAGDNEQIIQSDSVNKWFMPWREMVIFIFLALVAYGAYVFWKKYQNKYYGGIGWVEYEVEDGDTVQSLMKKFAVDWKVFVKTNKIKKPYILEVGQMIKVPKMEGEDSDSGFNVDEGIKEDINIEKPKNKNIINLKNKEESQEIGEIGQDVIDENNIELSDIASEASFSVSGIENKSGDPDFVDSALFFGEEKKNETTEADNLKEETQGEFEIKKEDAPKKKTITKPLAKKTQENQVTSIEKEVKDEYPTEREDDSEDLIIKGDKSDAQSSRPWLVYLLLIVIIILLAGVGLLLFQNKKMLNMKVSSQPEIVIESAEVPAESQTPTVADTAQQQESVPQIEAVQVTDISIKVLNGSGVAGAAGKAKEFLADKKYKSVEAGNYSSDTVDGTIVYYSEDKFKAEAQWISDMLKDKEIISEIKLASSDEEKSMDIVIILGK